MAVIREPQPEFDRTDQSHGCFRGTVRASDADYKACEVWYGASDLSLCVFLGGTDVSFRRSGRYMCSGLGDRLCSSICDLCCACDWAAEVPEQNNTRMRIAVLFWEYADWMAPRRAFRGQALEFYHQNKFRFISQALFE
jgi:hypothetical protein